MYQVIPVIQQTTDQSHSSIRSQEKTTKDILTFLSKVKCSCWLQNPQNKHMVHRLCTGSHSSK